MSRRPAGSWREHVERQARRHLHVAHLAIFRGDELLALEALALAADDLIALAAITAGGRPW